MNDPADGRDTKDTSRDFLQSSGPNSSGKPQRGGMGAIGAGCLGFLAGFAVGAWVAYSLAPKGYNGMGNSIASGLFWMAVICGVGVVTGIVGALIGVALMKASD